MNIIAVSSFKGGTAKTSTTLNIGAALAKFHDQKVLLVDFDAQANLTAGLGFDPDTQESMASVLQKKSKVEEVIVSTEDPNLFLIPADTWLERVEVTDALAGDRYSHERLKEILTPLPFDTIIIDTPPSLCWLTESALIAAQYSLVCATPEFYSVKGLQRLSSFLNNIGLRHPLQILGVALSFWNPRGKSNKTFLEVIENTFPKKVLSSKIRRDVAVSESSVFGRPVFETAPKSRASQDYTDLAQEILTRMERKAGLQELCLK